MTKRTRSLVQAAEMRFLCRMAGLTLRDRVRSSAIWEGLGVELLLLRSERSQLRWFWHLIRLPPGRHPLELCWAHPTGRGPEADPGHTGEIISPNWPGNIGESPRRGWNLLQRKRRSGPPYSLCRHHNPHQGKLKAARQGKAILALRAST